MFGFLDKFIRKPLGSEMLRVQNYMDQTHTAQQLLTSQNVSDIIKGLLLLFELSHSYPHHTQYIISQLTSFLRNNFSISPDGAPGKNEILEFGIRLLAGIPRHDRNGQPFYFNLHKLNIQHMDLTRINCTCFSFKGTRFSQVNLTRALFGEADLSGALFENCRLDHANLRKARMYSYAPDDGKPTRIIGSRLLGINLHEAEIEYCEIQNFDAIDLSKVSGAIAENKIRILGESITP